MTCSALKGSDLSARQRQQLGIQLHEIGFETIVARTPVPIRFQGADAQHREVPRRVRVFNGRRELVADVLGAGLADQALAVGQRDNGPQHSLVLCVWLEKVEVRHDCNIIGSPAGNLNGTQVPQVA